jgi:hypothetical protein
MESVIIAAPAPYDDQFRARLEQIGPLVLEAAETLVVERQATRVYVRRDDSIAGDMEPEQLAAVVSRIPEPVFYAVDFSDLFLCKQVLELIADDPSLIVDNDYGVILPGPEFVDRLRRDETWDWRADRP